MDQAYGNSVQWEIHPGTCAQTNENSHKQETLKKKKNVSWQIYANLFVYFIINRRDDLHQGDQKGGYVGHHRKNGNVVLKIGSK